MIPFPEAPRRRAGTISFTHIITMLGKAISTAEKPTDSITVPTHPETAAAIENAAQAMTEKCTM